MQGYPAKQWINERGGNWTKVRSRQRIIEVGVVKGRIKLLCTSVERIGL